MTTLPGTLADTELHELIRIIKETQGFDFSNYSKTSLKRRLSRIITLKKLGFQDLKEVLTLPAGFLVLIGETGVTAIIDDKGKDVWRDIK